MKEKTKMILDAINDALSEFEQTTHGKLWLVPVDEEAVAATFLTMLKSPTPYNISEMAQTIDAAISGAKV